MKMVLKRILPIKLHWTDVGCVGGGCETEEHWDTCQYFVFKLLPVDRDGSVSDFRSG